MAQVGGGVTCPKCGGPTWDERKSKFWDPSKNRPTHKCRDKGCNTGVWVKDEASTPAPVAPVKALNATPQAQRTVAAIEFDGVLVSLYEQTFQRLVTFHADTKLPLVTPDAIATLAEKLAVTLWMSK